MKLNFDATQVDPQQSFDPIPAGKYTAAITKSEIKPTKKGGQRLALELTVMEGEFKGRKLFDGLNIQNENPVAQEIAYKVLSSICHACCIMQVEDSSQLHGIAMEVKVNVEPAQGQYEAKNGIKGYKALEGQASEVPPFMNQAAPVAPQAPAAPQWTPPSTSATPPTGSPLKFFRCDHCFNVMTEHAQLPACPKCGCPNHTEYPSLSEATQGKALPAPAAPVAPVIAAPVAPVVNAAPQWTPPAAPAPEQQVAPTVSAPPAWAR